MTIGSTGNRPTGTEADRLAALRGYGILDTVREKAFDGIAKAAAFVCGTPIALINFIDEDRQWTKAGVGLSLNEMPLNESVCGCAIRQPGAFIVPDLREDQRFGDIPFVAERPFLRFYAGVRLETAEGCPLGMLCVLDDKPRPEGLTDEQVETLSSLAEAAMSHLELRRASTKLVERERRFRTILDAIPQNIWTARPDGFHDYFNQRWCAFTGVQPDRCDGDGWLDLIHPEDRERIQSRRQHSLETGDDYEIEYRLQHSSGEYRWMLARAHAIRNKRGKIERWLGTSTDIHQTKMVEQELAQREEHYRGLIDASAVVVWFAGPDGLITHSKGWTELTGQVEREYAGPGWLKAVHPDDRARVIPVWQAALASETFYQAEFRVRRLNGEYRWVLASAVPIHRPDGSLREWVGSIADIHDRRLAEERLQASEERLRLAAETTSLGIWDVDLISGQREWTSEAKAIIGLPDEAPVTRDSFLERVHPEDRTTVETSFFATFPDAPLDYSGTYRIIRVDTGEERWVAATGRTLLDSDGQPIRKIGTVQDITTTERSKIALRASEERLRLALQASRMIAWEQDLTTSFITRSPNAIELLGIGSGPLSEMLDRIHPEDRGERERLLSQSDRIGTEAIEVRYTTPKGQMIWLGVRGERAGPNRLVGVTFDITDRKNAEAEIWRAANHDALTGLPNRALFQQHLEHALDAAKRNDTSVSLLLLDFDHFKEINDTLGHDAGDAFLKETARRLTGLTRDCDTIARFSGDEFAVLLVEPLRLEHASRLAEIMIEKLSEPFLYSGRAVASKASIGVAAFPDHDVNSADLLKDADIALFEAKAQGRNRVITYCPVLRSAVEQRIALLEEVRNALPKNQIVPFYQPKVCLATGRIVGFEVLARWWHPDKGFLTPGHFRVAFDDPQLALALSKCLLGMAVSDLRHWLDAGLDPGRIAFNLSSCEFSQPDLTDHVFRLLDEGRIPPEHFEVEVTETVLLSRNPDAIAMTLRRFHEKGISIALDDFGTGFASLSHLKHFPVSHIKIDQSFVRNLGHDVDDHAIVAAIIELGKSLNMQVTAEGVETEGQAQHLRTLGCDYGQGYFFAKPAGAPQVPYLLSKQVK